MDIFSVFTLFGGLAFFLYGMHVMSGGLEKLAGGKLESTLQRMTSNPFKSLALGAGITIAIQSSSAMTVMLVGLVNSGIMQLEQTINLLFGSNIGTTLTAWILSTAGIRSSNIFLRFLKPENFSPIVALIGIILIMFAKSKRRKDLGGVFVGFSILMYGMTLMSSAVSPLADMPEFSHLLTAFNNPLLGVLVGAVFTGIIQSSAASVGILQALSQTGGITYDMAIPVIMGLNIGTCVTALISALGVNKNAKRVAVIHISAKIIGTAVCLVLYYGANAVFHFSFGVKPVGPVAIAMLHTAFNVLTTILLIPFPQLLLKIARMVVRDSKKEENFTFLDERLLITPGVAIRECDKMTMRMCTLARDSLFSAMSLLDDFSQEKADQILENEEKIDLFEDRLGSYLVKISARDLSDADARQIAKMLHTIGDFERLGDHAVNLLDVARELKEKRISFSPEARRELGYLTDALQEILVNTVDAFVSGDREKAALTEPLEQVIDLLIGEIKAGHVGRLQAGDCTIQMGFVLSDLLTNYERISDHCSNVAVALIEVSHNNFDTHQYLHAVKQDSASFQDAFRAYCDKYYHACFPDSSAEVSANN